MADHQKRGPLFPEGESMRRRDEAIDRVIANAGEDFGLTLKGLVPLLFYGQEVLPEEWKAACERHGLKAKPQAWSAHTNTLLRAGVIQRVGRSNMKKPSSHGRETPRYRVRELRESDLDF